MESFSVDPKKLEEMLVYCVDFAKQMLQSHGEFHPFGAQLDSSGKVIAVGASNGEELPKGQELTQVLVDGFRSRFANGEIAGVALAANVNIPARFNPPFPDGIRVHLECEGFSRMFYVPYRIAKPRMLDKIRRKTPSIDYADFITVDMPASLTVEAK